MEEIPFVLETAVPTIQSSRHRCRAGPHIAHSAGVTNSHQVPVSHPGRCSCKHNHNHNINLKLACGYIIETQKNRNVNEEAVFQMYPPSAVQCCDLLSCCWSAQSQLHLTGTPPAVRGDMKPEDDMRRDDGIVSAPSQITLFEKNKTNTKPGLDANHRHGDVVWEHQQKQLLTQKTKQNITWGLMEVFTG